ncbi:MAG: FxsA family protein [Epsilonproteobacteria bacterium]|nr:FxsA family protein [Campylobacterota bacterium]
MIFILIFFIIEILVSIKFGITIGFGWSVLWVVATSVIGIVLLKLSPYAVVKSFERIATQKFDILSAQNAALSYILGAILLIIPGVFTDFLGIFLLLYTLYLNYFAKMPDVKPKNEEFKGDSDVIDVEIIEYDNSIDSSTKRKF